MKIRLGNVSARLDTPPSSAVRDWLDEYLSIDLEDFIKTRRMRRPKFRRRTLSLLDPHTLKFPRGLLRLVHTAAARDVGAVPELRALVEAEVLDTRRRMPALDWSADVGWTESVIPDPDAPRGHRDYRFQGRAVRLALPAANGIIEAPTGAGKTEMAVAMSRVAGVRSLYLVPNTDLLRQGAERFRDLTGLEPGIVGDGRWEVREPFTVGSFHTLSKRYRARDPATLQLLHRWTQAIFIDECHQLPASTFYGVAMSTRAAFYRFGFSATPMERKDKKSLYMVGALGPVLYRISGPRCVELGVISEPVIRMLRLENDTGAGSWQRARLRGVVKNRRRNDLVTEVVRSRAAKPTIVFVKEREHGAELLQRFRKAGLGPLQYIHGDKGGDSREAAKRRIERGEIDVTIATVGVWKQGISIDALRSTVLACSGASPIETKQAMGRGSRRDTGKATFEHWDFFDEDDKYLERWSRDRRKAYEKAGYKVRFEQADGLL